jgi:hypothetical protein
MDPRGSQKTRHHSPEDLVSVLNPADAERWRRIQRDVGMGYAITMKELCWLVRLTEKLLDQSQPIAPKPIAEKIENEKSQPRRKARA